MDKQEGVGSAGSGATVPFFTEYWATKKAQGFQYGDDALHSVRLGYEDGIAVAQGMADELARLRKVLAGLPQDAIDGGWTAAGMSAYAKKLEDELARVKGERDSLIEKAARVCESVSHDNPMTALDCADAIRALSKR